MAHGDGPEASAVRGLDVTSECEVHRYGTESLTDELVRMSGKHAREEPAQVSVFELIKRLEAETGTVSEAMARAAARLPEAMALPFKESARSRSAHFLLAIAVRLLPPLERDRYLEEFRAELLDVPGHTRLTHALSLLRGVFVLRLRRGFKNTAGDTAVRGAKG